jgi:hypothetical protein
MSRLFGLAVLAVATLGFAGSSSADLFMAHLDGLTESPPNASLGTGSATLDFDLAAHTFHIQVTFQDLSGTTTASHVHSATSTPFAGNAGVATQVPTFDGFPLGVTSGTYDHIFDTSLDSFYNPSFLADNGGTAAAAEIALFTGISEGRAYLNIHTSLFPSGEIRGFLRSVPEPGSLALLGLGSMGLLLLHRRR